MRKFNTIKKSRKKSKDIDEKIEYLNNECQKTGLNEITMSTSGMYQGSTKVPNQDFIDFEGTTQGGQGLGLSGADGNNVGSAILGVVSGVTGVALSPPHPVTGVRRSARHITTGLGDSTLLRPGVTISRGFSDNPPQYTMGSVLWFYDPNYNSGEGQWCNLEFSNFDGDSNGKWFFWDTVKTGQFAGLYIVNTNLSQHPCGDISGKIAGLNFGTNGNLGAPETTVLTKNDLDDPGFVPVDTMSPEAYRYLFGKATGVASGANYDMYNWILKTYGMPAAEWYLKTGKTQGNPFVPYGSYFPRASNPKDGEMFAFFGGNKNETSGPPTKRTRQGTLDATAAATGGYAEMTPEIIIQKYGMSWQEYMNLPF